MSAENGQREKLIECLSFLRALACKNLTVQTRYENYYGSHKNSWCIQNAIIVIHRLLEHLDVFIKAVSGEIGFQVAELLQEVFSGGPSISLSVKEEQLWRIIKLMFRKGKEFYAQRNAVLLRALNELLMVIECRMTY